MRVAKYVAVIAAAACLSTSAMAGGFSFTSAGGNLGKWAYSDAASFGGAECIGIKSCATTSGGAAESYSQIGRKSAYSTSNGGNSSAAEGYGLVSAQSHSGAVAGSGVGNGFGFKAGSFTLQCGCR
jgi:hypothetical protein